MNEWTETIVRLEAENKRLKLEYEDACKCMNLWKADADRYRDALEEIKLGKGAFRTDPLTHAGNTINNMVDIATESLKENE